MKYSASTLGFYASDIHGAEIPADAISIDHVTYQDLIEKQAQGARILPDQFGVPVAVFPEPPTEGETRLMWRTSAALSRADFLKALASADVLSASDAVRAARGLFPRAFTEALGGNSDVVAAQIDWAAASHMQRLHPLTVGLFAAHAAKTGLDADAASALADALFGWPAETNTPDTGN